MTENNLAINRRMPYMLFNWANHASRVWRLSLEERGLLDTIRCELWSVNDCRMPLELLKQRLRVEEGSPLAELLHGLVRADYLRVADGWVHDEFLLGEYNEAKRKAEVNALNGRKGGRPRKATDARSGVDPTDF